MIAIYKKFFAFSGRQRRNFNQAILLSVIHAVFEAMRIPAVAVVLKAILEDNMSFQTVYLALGIMVLSIAGCGISRNLMTMRSTMGSYTMCAQKRIEIGEHLKYMPMGYFNNNSLGYITSVTTNTVELMQDMATNVIQMSLQGFITSGAISIVLCLFNFRIGSLAVGGIGLFLLANSFLQRASQKLAPRKSYEDARLVEAIMEYIKGISVVKSFNLDQDAGQKVKSAISANNNINFTMEKKFIPYMGLQTIVLKLSGVVISMASIYFYTRGSMDLLHCLLMIICSFILYSQLEAGGAYSSLLRVVDLSMDKINEIFDTPVMDAAGKEIKAETYDIEAKNVSFSYENRKIIDEVSFVIPQGTTTAIVGPSGGGKTTVCSLIARFWDVNSGAITLGGINVKNYTLDSLMSNISMVFQNVYLFHDTVENNIKFGKPDAMREEVIEAAKKACCHDFIMKLPDGYDTVIGESGGNISGGEKQRISIARALLKDAPVIILDEATANVDPENEKQLQLAIRELTRNKTIIMIAHRLKTIRDADQILVIDKGKIVQRGKHEKLVNLPGIYSDFIQVREKAVGWKL